MARHSRIIYLFDMAPEERIRLLCAQLFRAENPVVVDTVAAQLQQAIREYSGCKVRQIPPDELELSPATSAE